MRPAAIACFALVGAACGASAFPLRPTAAPWLLPDTRAVFAADEVRSWTLADACGDGARTEPNRAWMPDSALVRRIDEQVGRTLRRRLAAEGEHASPPMDYHRQYAGVYCDGAPVVVVEGSRLVASYTAQRRLRDAAADTFAWRRERFPRMSHAGTSFFQASYRVDGRPLRPLVFD